MRKENKVRILFQAFLVILDCICCVKSLPSFRIRLFLAQPKVFDDCVDSFTGTEKQLETFKNRDSGYIFFVKSLK